MPLSPSCDLCLYLLQQHQGAHLVSLCLMKSEADTQLLSLGLVRRWLSVRSAPRFICSSSWLETAGLLRERDGIPGKPWFRLLHP